MTGAAIDHPPPGSPKVGPGHDERTGRRGGGKGVVVLATPGVPFDADAVDVALEAAREASRPLIVTNVLPLEPLMISLSLGYMNVAEDPELVRAIRAPAERAYALGLAIERVRIRSPHPIDALLEFVHEREASLLVFGPDRKHLRRWRYRRWYRAICDRATCLVWAPD